MTKWYQGTKDITEGGWYWRYYAQGDKRFLFWDIIFATQSELELDSDSLNMWYYGPIKLPQPPRGELVGVRVISREDNE